MPKFDEPGNAKKADGRKAAEAATASEPQRVTLQLQSRDEANLLYQLVREGNKAFASGNVEPEILGASAGLMTRIKQLLVPQQ